MSVTIMAKIWPVDLDPSDKLVLLAIADNANDEGKHAYASEPTLIIKTSLKERTLRYALRHLQRHGWLTVEVRGSEYGTNLYSVHPEAGEPCQNRTTCLRGAPRAPQQDTAPEGHHVPGEGHHVPPRGARRAGAKGHHVPGSIEEPPGEPSEEPQPPSAVPPDPVVEILEAEIIDDEGPEQGPEPKGEFENTGTVLAAYIDWRRDQGIAAIDKRTKGILSRQLKEAFDAGHPAEVIKRGLWCWHQSPTHASALLSFIDTEARNGGRPARISEHERRLAASVKELLVS